MKSFFISVLLVYSIARCDAQSISIIDFVRIKDNKKTEALFYYENNWKVYRDIALKKGYIKSYNLLQTKPDSLASFNLMLITEYSDSTQHSLAEDRFNQIIKEIRPNGPKLLNSLKPNEFRQSVFLRRAVSRYGGEQTK
jgi:hypothetical protein